MKQDATQILAPLPGSLPVCAELFLGSSDTSNPHVAWVRWLQSSRFTGGILAETFPRVLGRDTTPGSLARGGPFRAGGLDCVIATPVGQEWSLQPPAVLEPGCSGGPTLWTVGVPTAVELRALCDPASEPSRLGLKTGAGAGAGHLDLGPWVGGKDVSEMGAGVQGKSRPIKTTRKASRGDTVRGSVCGRAQPC